MFRVDPDVARRDDRRIVRREIIGQVADENGTLDFLRVADRGRRVFMAAKRVENRQVRDE